MAAQNKPPLMGQGDETMTVQKKLIRVSDYHSIRGSDRMAQFEATIDDVGSSGRFMAEVEISTKYAQEDNATRQSWEVAEVSLPEKILDACQMFGVEVNTDSVCEDYLTRYQVAKAEAEEKRLLERQQTYRAHPAHEFVKMAPEGVVAEVVEDEATFSRHSFVGLSVRITRKGTTPPNNSVKVELEYVSQLKGFSKKENTRLVYKLSEGIYLGYNSYLHKSEYKNWKRSWSKASNAMKGAVEVLDERLALASRQASAKSVEISKQNATKALNSLLVGAGVSAEMSGEDKSMVTLFGGCTGLLECSVLSDPEKGTMDKFRFNLSGLTSGQVAKVIAVLRKEEVV